MARIGKAKDPERDLAALHEKRLALAHKRHALDATEGAQRAVIDGATDRKRAARLAEARGDTHPETPEQVELALRQAQAEMVVVKEKREAIREAEQEVKAEVDAVIDAHPEHFLAAAVGASEGTSEVIAVALNATRAAVTAWMGTREAWGRVRLSRGRRGLDLGPEVPISDLGVSVNELSKEQPRPWPGGRREAYERFLEHERANAQAIRVSNAEAISRFGDAA